MIAACLPLPTFQHLAMAERLQSTSHLDLDHEAGIVPGPTRGGAPSPDELRHYTARWWRNLNRGMSVVGLLVVGAVIGLTVVGVREEW